MAKSKLFTSSVQGIIVTLSLTEKSYNAGLLVHILFTSSGTYRDSRILAAVNASSPAITLGLKLGGVNFINVFGDVSQGYKEAHISCSRCQVIENTMSNLGSNE